MIRDIQSAANPFIKHLRALLGTKKARQESGCFVLEGLRGIRTLLDHPSDTCTLYQLVISDDWHETANLPDIETIRLPRSLFDKLSDVRTAQGIMAVVHYTHRPFSVPETGHLLLVDQLRDPGNLGTLIRSAVGAGFRGVLLHGDCVDPLNPKVVRASMGTLAFADLHTVSDDEVRQLIEAGYECCITAGHEGENLYEAAFSDRILLAVGSEAHGISESLAQQADRRLTIPMDARCESLNAAVAGSICMFAVRCGSADG